MTVMTLLVMPMVFLAGVLVADTVRHPPVAPPPVPRPAIDAEIAKLTESMYVARQLDAGEVSAARGYLAQSMDLDILALADKLEALPPQRKAAALAVLAEIHEMRANYPQADAMRDPAGPDAPVTAMRADVAAVLERAARQAPQGRLQF